MLQSETQDPVALITRYGWLAACPDWFRDWALSRLRWRNGMAGTQISQGGDEGGAMWCAAAGQIAYVSALGAASVGTSFFGWPGSWWGQAPLFGLPYQTSAIGRTDYVVGSLPLADIRAFLAREPRGWEWFGHSLTDVQIVTAGAYQDQLLPDSRRRLAAAILRLSGRRHRRYPVFTPDLIWCTQEELAAAATLSRNTAGAHFRRFEAEGLVEGAYRSIRLLDPARLEAFALAED